MAQLTSRQARVDLEARVVKMRLFFFVSNEHFIFLEEKFLLGYK